MALGLLLLPLRAAPERAAIVVDGITPDLAALAKGDAVRWTLTLRNQTDEALMFAPRPAHGFTWTPKAAVVPARGTATIDAEFTGTGLAAPSLPEFAIRKKTPDARGWEEMSSGTLGAPGAFADVRWNTWISPKGKRESIATRLEPKKTYVVTFDLAPWSWDAAGASSAKPDAELRAALEAVSDPSLTLRVVPVVGGKSVKLARSSDRAPKLELDLAKLRAPGDAPKPGESVPARSARLAAGRVEIAIDAIADGCATLALSLWDEELRRPLDHVTRTITVGSATCPGDAMATAGLAGLLAEGGDATAAPGATAPAGSPDAALHVFQAGDTSVAVWADAKGTRAWTLAENPATALADPLGISQDLDHAHNGAGYGPLQKRIARLFFPPGDADAKAALTSLRAIAASAGSTRPLLLARLVDRGGVPRAIPLGLLDDGAGEPVGARIDVVQSFALRDRGAAPRCVDASTLFVPADLAAGALAGCSAPAVPDATWAQFEQWLDAEESAGAPESVLVLAHQAKGRLGFRDAGVQYRRPSDMTRPLESGSMAFLVACNAALDADQDEGTSWLSRFERQGVDAAVASPFAVRLDVGVCFARHVAAEIARAKTTTRGASVAEIQRRAGDALREDLRRTKKTASINLLPSPYEFSLIGDPSLRICGAPGNPP